MSQPSLFEKLCQPLKGDFLPAAFPLPLQQFALSGAWTERHLTEVERRNWLSRTMLGYVLHKRPTLQSYADRYVPALLTPAFIAWLTETLETVENLPITRFMQMIGTQLAPYDRVYDLKKPRGVLQLYGDLAGSFSAVLNLPSALIPDAIYEALAKPAPGLASALEFPLSTGMAHLWRTLFMQLPFEPASAPHAQVFLNQFLSLIVAGRCDPRLISKESAAWLNAPCKEQPALTNFMALMLQLAGLQPDAKWQDAGFIRNLSQRLFTETWPTLVIPPVVAEAHEKIAAALGAVPTATRRDEKEPLYVWKNPGAQGLDPQSRQVNLLAVDDVSRQGARITQHLARSLSAGGVKAALIPDKAETRRVPAPGPINLFACRMEHLGDFMLRRGLGQFEGRYNIGYAAWETDRLPEGIRIGLGLLDEIWVASEYEKQIFAKETDRPVFVLPCGVNEEAPSKNITRASLGLPEDAFLFTTAIDCNDWISRKNALAALQAFQQAFPSEQKVALLVKTRDIGKSMNQREEGAIQRLQNIWDKDKRIFTLHDDLHDSEMQALLGFSDAYISLHRASAFGATLVEAMLQGKPVIATDASGSRDYISGKTGYPISAVKAEVVFEGFAFLDKEPDHAWADPAILEAAAAMQKIFSDRAGARAIAAEGQKLAQARYLAGPCGKAMAERIHAILQSEGFSRKMERAA